jgi:hypothetical protein
MKPFSPADGEVVPASKEATMALHDPQTTKLDLAEFTAFVKSKDPEEQYCFEDAGNCAVAAFGKETGRDWLVDVNSLEEVLPDNPGEIIVALALSPMTYGGLGERLEAIQP